MVDIESYMKRITQALRDAFGDRLCYVGLQGSYLRGEAREDSDVDVMVVIDRLNARDLRTYRQIVRDMGDADLSCGFLCGREALKVWNPLETCHALHSTGDYYGHLAPLLNPCNDRDIANYINFNAGCVYHALVHRFVHRDEEIGVREFPDFKRDVFFILQNLTYLETGVFPQKKAEMADALRGLDRDVWQMLCAVSDGTPFDYDEAAQRLLDWCLCVMNRCERV